MFRCHDDMAEDSVVREAVSTQGLLSLWNIVRIINILIMVRLFRIIPHIKVNTHKAV